MFTGTLFYIIFFFLQQTVQTIRLTDHTAHNQEELIPLWLYLANIDTTSATGPYTAIILWSIFFNIANCFSSRVFDTTTLSPEDDGYLISSFNHMGFIS